MIKTVIFFFLLTYQTVQANINVKSIIKLNQNIPEECGLSFSVKKNYLSDISFSIKKLKNKDTQTHFIVNSKKSIIDADIITSSSKISEILKIKKSSNNYFSLKGETNDDSAPFVFQELLINGGIIKINDESYEIKGPIDSKVRLEYLFCTGEMFLPNYDK